MLGLGTAGAAVASQVPLFGVGATPLIGQAPHLVFEGAPLVAGKYEIPGSMGVMFRPGSGATQRYALDGLPTYAEGSVGVHRRSFKGGVRAKWDEPSASRPALIYDEYEMNVEVGVNDPHVAFYQAAMQLRDEIDQKMQDDFRDSRVGREGVVVTVADAPIIAIPKDRQGFYLHVDLGHMIVSEPQLVGPESPVSRSGEIPIEMPNEIDLRLMMMLDEEVRAMGILPKNPPTMAAEAWRRLQRRL